jgi:hypothetical protein
MDLDKAKIPVPHLFIQFEGAEAWMHLGPASGLKAGDLKTVLLDFEPDEDVNFEVRMLTEEEAEGLPDFDGWYPLPDCE